MNRRSVLVPVQYEGQVNTERVDGFTLFHVVGDLPLYAVLHPGVGNAPYWVIADLKTGYKLTSYIADRSKSDAENLEIARLKLRKLVADKGADAVKRALLAKWAEPSSHLNAVNPRQQDGLD